MTRQWDYYAATPSEAAELVDSPDHRVWSAQWVRGLPEDGSAAFVIVAATGVTPVHTALATAIMADDKDPIPPPPPPPPPYTMQGFATAAAFYFGAAPRALEEPPAPVGDVEQVAGGG